MKLLPILLLLIGLLWFFRPGVDDTTLKAASEAYERGAIIVDVRTPSEYLNRHIEGAINLPLQNLSETMQELDKAKEIIVYCRSGNRSATAQEILQAAGYTVYDVATQGDWERRNEIAQ